MSAEQVAEFKLESEIRISAPRGDAEVRVPVRMADWNRIRAAVDQMGEPLYDHAMSLATTALGAAIGLGATVATLLTTDSEPQAGVLPSLIIATAFSVLFAVCFYLIARQQKAQARLTSEHVCKDMDSILDAFKRESS